MLRSVYEFVAEVWLYPGIGGWHFVNVPDKIAKPIREKCGKGMIKVLCEVKSTKWNTSLFPYKNHKGEFGYLISIKKTVRNKESIFKGDRITVSFKVI